MHCPYCGKPVDDGIAYCPWCGGGLRSDTSSPIPENVFGNEDDGVLVMPDDMPAPAPDRTVARDQVPLETRVSPLRPTRRDGSSMRTPQDPDNNGSGRLLVGLAIAAATLAILYLVWTQGCSRLSPAPVAPAPQEQEASQPQDVQVEGDEQPQEQDDSQEEAADAGVTVRQTLAEYSWDELSDIAGQLEAANSRDEALEIARSYNLVDDDGLPTGSTKPVTLSDGTVIEVFLADIRHDELADGSFAGLTFLSWNVPLSHRMNADDTNAGGWRDSELRSWLSTSCFGMLPEDLRAAIRPAAKRTNNVGQTHDEASVSVTQDALWVPSVTEVAGRVDWVWSSDADNSGGYNAVLNAEGSQYVVFSQSVTNTDGPNDVLALRGISNQGWWLRTPSASVTGNFRYVLGDGNPCGFGGASVERGICLGFCL